MASAVAKLSPTAWPISSLKYGKCHLSGDSITPSSDRNSAATTFLMRASPSSPVCSTRGSIRAAGTQPTLQVANFLKTFLLGCSAGHGRAGAPRGDPPMCPDGESLACKEREAQPRIWAILLGGGALSTARLRRRLLRGPHTATRMVRVDRGGRPGGHRFDSSRQRWSSWHHTVYRVPAWKVLRPEPFVRRRVAILGRFP